MIFEKSIAVKHTKARPLVPETKNHKDRMVWPGESRGMCLIYDDGTSDDALHFLSPEEVLEWFVEEIQYIKEQRSHQSVYESWLAIGRTKKAFKTRGIPRLMIGVKDEAGEE